MRSAVSLAWLVGLFVLSPVEIQAAVVRFAQPIYTVVVDVDLTLEVQIDYEAGDPTDLFSFGVRLVPEAGTALTPSSIEVADALNFLTTNGPPALTDLDPAVLGAKGTIDIASAAPPYAGARLVTFNVSFPELGVYNLDLDFYNTLGPSEQLFVSGNGTLLDPILVFESAMISVVPEPAMSLFVSACLLFRCRASACRQARS